MMPNCDSCQSLSASEVNNNNNNNNNVVVELFSTLVNITHGYNIKLMKKNELLFLPFQKFLSLYSHHTGIINYRELKSANTFHPLVFIALLSPGM